MKPRRSLILLASILFAGTAAHPLRAQNTTFYVNRSIAANCSAQGGPSTNDYYASGDQMFADMSTNGVFNHFFDDQASFPLDNLHGHIEQNSDITITDGGFTVTGTLSSVDSTSGTHDTNGDYGMSGAELLTRIEFAFFPTGAFSYSLTANVARSYDGTPNISEAHVVYCLLQSNDGSTNYAVYGYYPGSWADGAYPLSGTNSGALGAGSYVLVASIDNGSAWNGSPQSQVGDYTYLANSSVTFTLSVTNAVSVAPPVITSLSAAAAGSYNLAWTAPRAGTYRVLSSPDLVTWSEAIAAAAYAAGSNANIVNALPGSAAGFYRIEFMQ